MARLHASGPRSTGLHRLRTIAQLRAARISGFQYQQVRGDRINRGTGVPEREVLTRPPERQQVVEVLAARLAALARHIDCDRVVPVGEIENLPVTCAGGLLERFAVEIGSLHDIAIARSLGRSTIEEAD